MSEPGAPPEEPAGGPEPHPVDAVLEALRAVPDALLRPLEPATLYVPPQGGPGWAGTAAGGGAGSGARSAGASA